MLKMCSSKIFATAKSVAQATKFSALMLGGAATVAAVSVLVGASAASALDFNFSFVGNEGTPGTVTGRIYGLIDNSVDTAATGLDIFSNPLNNSFNGSYNFNNIYNNEFSVINGQITQYRFVIEDTSSTPGLRLVMLGGDLMPYLGDDSNVWTSGNQPGGVTFTPATTAEVPFDFDPAFGAALGLPLFIGLRHLKKRVASKKLKYNPTGTVS